VNRGTGILNNRRYVGMIVWGHSEWKRSAADSKKRRHRMLDKGRAHETPHERLWIVPQELWDRVKARQQRRSQEMGAKVKGGQRQGAPGAWRPGKYLFSGLPRCGICSASFVLRNREYYCCASWWNGAACTNVLNISRKLVEQILLAGIREDLRNPSSSKRSSAASMQPRVNRRSRRPTSVRRSGSLRRKSGI
jgi:site-specific DNA recombinase